MDLRDYLRVLRRGWTVLLAFVILGTAIGTVVTLTTKKVYEASVQLFVATSGTSDPAQLAQGNTFTQDRVQSYTSIATSPAVTVPVVRNLHLNLTAEQLADKISADAPQNKVLINLHVTDHDARHATDLANAVATQFATVVQQTEQTSAQGSPVVRLTVIHPASVPTGPVKPKRAVDIGLGFVLGLLVGIGIIVLRDFLDTSVKGAADFEPLGVPVLGHVPFDKRAQRLPIAFRGDLHSARAEAYRQLRTNLQFVEVDNPPRVIAVTSAVPGEGKTTTSINLAASLAEAGYRVCLVEADLRRPTIAAALGVVGDVGLTTVLIGKAPVESVLQSAGEKLTVLTSGPVPPNPSELLNSDHAHAIIAEVASMFEYVVIDTAPLLPVTDGAEVATMSDATVIVARAGKTSRTQAARSIDALTKVGRHPVGVVINMIPRARGGYEYEYGYYYVPYRPRRKAHRDDEAGVRVHQSAGTELEKLGLVSSDARGDFRSSDPAYSAEPRS